MLVFLLLYKIVLWLSYTGLDIQQLYMQKLYLYSWTEVGHSPPSLLFSII